MSSHSEVTQIDQNQNIKIRIKEIIYEDVNCQIWDIIFSENEFTNRHRSKMYMINFDFDYKIPCEISDQM